MGTINSTYDYEGIIAELGEAVVEAVKAELPYMHSWTSRYELTEELIANSEYAIYTKYFGDILLFSNNADNALDDGLVSVKGQTAASLMGYMAYWALLADVNDWLVKNHADLTV